MSEKQKRCRAERNFKKSGKRTEEKKDVVARTLMGLVVVVVVEFAKFWEGTNSSGKHHFRWFIWDSKCSITVASSVGILW